MHLAVVLQTDVYCEREKYWDRRVLTSCKMSAQVKSASAKTVNSAGDLVIDFIRMSSEKFKLSKWNQKQATEKDFFTGPLTP